MLKVCSSSTLAEAVKPANAYTLNQTPHSLSQTSVYLNQDLPPEFILAAFNSFVLRTSDPSQLVPTFCDVASLQRTLYFQNPHLSSHHKSSHEENPQALIPIASPTPPPRYVRLFNMCHIENVHFCCGHPEDTKYTMCELAMSEMNHVTTTTETTKTYPCAACFARGVEEKAKQTREQQGKGR